MAMTRPITDEDAKIYQWIMELVQGDRKETALLELSKKREQVEDLAVILWHAVGKCSSYFVGFTELTMLQVL